MFSATNPELPYNSFTMKQDHKLFSKVVSKESSIANPSFKVYYGGLPGNVPFTWESEPGTPKHKFSEETLPPLTPPPSYYSKIPSNKPFKKHSRSNLLHLLFLKISLKKNHLPQSPSSTSSSSLFSNSDLSMRMPGNHCRSRFSSSSSSFDFRGDYEDEEEDVVVSPTSTVMCFGFRRVTNGAHRNCHRFD